MTVPMCPDCRYREDGGVRQFCRFHARVLGLDAPLEIVVWFLIGLVLGVSLLVGGLGYWIFWRP